MMGPVLRHVARRRPEWHVSYQAEEGRHQVVRGIAARHFAWGQGPPGARYDAEVQICLYDRWYGFADRPNTHVAQALRECFDLPWEADLGRYQVAVEERSLAAAATLLNGWNGKRESSRAGKGVRSDRFVAIHYQGDSAGASKDLTHAQADAVCRAAAALGRVPLILDWRRRSPLRCRRVTTPSAWGSDAEMVCAVIRQCDAFVGIDSGPAKCAGATDVPALVVWTGHHPAQFYDPAPNVTHLVPRGYHGLAPVRGDLGVVKFIEENYRVREYDSGDPSGEATAWLREVLR